MFNQPITTRLVLLGISSMCLTLANAAGRTGQAVVEEVCVSCHASGKDGAPKIGDIKAWTEHSKKGVESLVSSAITGHKAMPARAGMDKLGDTDLRNAVTYLVIQSATYKPKN
jgi:cytochrome c5